MSCCPSIDFRSACFREVLNGLNFFKSHVTYSIRNILA